MNDNINKTVNEILESYSKHEQTCRLSEDNIINKSVLIQVLEEIRKLLFPGYFDKNRVREEYIGYIVGDRIEFIQYNLKKQIAKALKGCEKCNDLSYDEVMESQKSWFMSSFQRFRQSVIILQQMLLRPLTAILPHTARMKSFSAIPDFLQSRFTEWHMNCGSLKSR